MPNRLSIMTRPLDQVSQFVYLFFVLLLGVGVRLFFARKRREIKCASLYLRPVQHHGNAAPDLHVFHAPTSKAECGRLSTDDTAVAGKIETTAAGNGQHLRNAC